MQTPAPWAPPEPLPGPIETERTLLRWFVPEDAGALHKAVDNHRESLLPWLPWAIDDHGTVEASASRIGWLEGQRTDRAAPDYTIGIFERSSGALLGGTGLHRIIPESGDAEIGYWLHAERRGQGFCTEAVAGLIGAAFGPWRLRRVRIVCAGSNTASQRVPERLGLRLEGRERSNRWVDGRGWDDSLMYAVLAPEWDTATGRVRA